MDQGHSSAIGALLVLVPGNLGDSAAGHVAVDMGAADGQAHVAGLLSAADQVPQLADYGYAKMKDQILLINEMTGEIVDVIPESQPQTTGQK